MQQFKKTTELWILEMHHMFSFWKQIITESLIVKITHNLQKYTTLRNKDCFINMQNGTVYKMFYSKHDIRNFPWCFT
jgi:hypothetical protein